MVQVKVEWHSVLSSTNTLERITLIPAKLGYPSYRSNLVDSKKHGQTKASIADYCDINLIILLGCQFNKLNYIIMILSNVMGFTVLELSVWLQLGGLYLDTLHTVDD